MSDEASSIICPECGTRNRPNSLFCAECGTMLPHENGDDANATASFTPVTNEDSPANESWNANDTGTTQIFTPRVGIGEPVSAPIDVSPWSAPVPAAPATYVREPGRRGFVLGIISAVLILIVFAFFLWSTVASDGFRDAITGIF